ncbi:MAG: phosphotransferase family protein [Bacteroidota bacterium]
MSTTPSLDQASNIRNGEELPLEALNAYLSQQLESFEGISALKQFPGGYSNLTYFLQSGDQEYVLRRPPFGANIKSAHDMGREYKVLSHLKGHYDKIPMPFLHCEDEAIIGAPFYLMERVQGVIMRPSRPPKPLPEPSLMRGISESIIDNLVALHALDLEETGLGKLGKPEGYTERQVSGWIRRYQKAKTDDIPAMDQLSEYMEGNLPEAPAPAFIHNDFKYDNLVLDPEDLTQVKAVLDWEMSTVGNPLMDLGTSMAYWVEKTDSPALHMFNLTALPGNLSRLEALERYAEKSGRDLSDILFYFVYACYKLAVIIQQIYARYVAGHTKDPRFAALIHVVQACSDTGVKALQYGRIHDFR